MWRYDSEGHTCNSAPRGRGRAARAADAPQRSGSAATRRFSPHGDMAPRPREASGPRQMSSAARTCGRTCTCLCSAAPGARVCSGPDRVPASHIAMCHCRGRRYRSTIWSAARTHAAQAPAALQTRTAGSRAAQFTLRGCAQRAGLKVGDPRPPRPECSRSSRSLAQKRTSNLVQRPPTASLPAHFKQCRARSSGASGSRPRAAGAGRRCHGARPRVPGPSPNIAPCPLPLPRFCACTRGPRQAWVDGG